MDLFNARVCNIYIWWRYFYIIIFCLVNYFLWILICRVTHWNKGNIYLIGGCTHEAGCSLLILSLGLSLLLLISSTWGIDLYRFLSTDVKWSFMVCVSFFECVFINSFVISGLVDLSVTFYGSNIQDVFHMAISVEGIRASVDTFSCV